MAERYEEILLLDKNQWTYGSPVLIEEGKLERDLISNRNLITINFVNICDIPLKEVYLTIYASDDEGDVSEIKYVYRELNLAPLAKFGGNVKLPVENEKAREFKLKISKIVCEYDSVWEKDEIFEACEEIEDIEAFGKAKDEEYEVNYKKSKELVKNDDSASIQEAIDILDTLLWYKNCVEIQEYAKRKLEIALRTENRKKKEEERKKLRQQRNKKIFCALGCLAVAIAIITAIVFATVIIPNHKLAQAKNYNKNGLYEKAIDLCKELNGYRDSEDVLTESYYQIGFRAYDKQEYEKTVEYLSKCGNYKASEKLLAQSNYNLGNAAIEAKDYDGAINYFNESISHTEDATIINHDKTGIAKAYYGKGELEKAWTTIQEVYAADNSVKSEYNAYGYAYAVQLQNDGKEDAALEIYKLTKKKKESMNKYGEIIYNRAVATAEGGDLSAAAKQLKEVKDDYSKAKTLYDDMTYFINKTEPWVGTWKSSGKETLKISTLMFKGELCIKVADSYLGYDTIISKKKRVTQIAIESQYIHYKLKKVHNYKITLSRVTNKIERTLRYDGSAYSRKYKKKKSK